MLKKKTIEFLSDSKAKTLKELITLCGVSERTMRSLLSELRQDEEKNGFILKTEYGKGYLLKIIDQTRFDAYVRLLDEDYGRNRHIRQHLMLYILLQQPTFISIAELCERIDVSKKTLQKDLEDIRKILNEDGLELQCKAHYGIRITGSEDKIRKAFSKYVVNSSYFTSMTQEYFKFAESIDRRQLEEIISRTLKSRNLIFTQIAFDSLVDHVLVLIYRLSQNNYIQFLNDETTEISLETYLDCAKELGKLIQQHYRVTVSEIEVKYLASQIAGKTLMESIPADTQNELRKKIVTVLQCIDEENLTRFATDEALINALMMHMYPLLSRIAYKIELNNPLIELVSTRYANVFLMAMKFIELWPDQEFVDFSRDEVGYLALHFAGHLERIKQESIDRYRRILLISELGRGNALLIKQKLEEAFPKALIMLSTCVDEEEIRDNHPNLILSSVPVDETKLSVPVYYIKDLIYDEDIVQIRDFMILKQNGNTSFQGSNWIDELFCEEFFIKTDEKDYLALIEAMSQRMAERGYADASFPQLVLERESRYSTVYENGVAGPHSMKLNALKECVGVIIPKKKLTYQNRDVEVIFLINLKKGNLFMYREIGRMLHILTQSPHLVSKIKCATQFDEFIGILKDIRY